MNWHESRVSDRACEKADNDYVSAVLPDEDTSSQQIASSRRMTLLAYFALASDDVPEYKMLKDSQE